MLTPLLTDRGHHVIAPDLPCDDPAATFDDYAEVVCDALGRRDDVVVVGHSLAGHTIPLVAARRPVRRLVYLCALVPELGRSLTDQLREDTEMLNPVYLKALGKTDELRRRAWVDEELARSLLFGDTDDCTRTRSPFRWVALRRSRAPISSARTTGWSVRSGRSASPMTGSVQSLWSSPGVTRRSFRGPHTSPTYCMA
jgi:pimeloyl-ACP methyl ester carboxylesterase